MIPSLHILFGLVHFMRRNLSTVIVDCYTREAERQSHRCTPMLKGLVKMLMACTAILSMQDGVIDAIACRLS